jgi:hypothetical protein
MTLKMVCGVALCAGIGLVILPVAGTPYQGIVDRNVFALKPPPPPPVAVPPAPPAPKPPPAIKITPIGIMAGFGFAPRALFKTPAPPPKPGAPPGPGGEQSYMLAVGQAQDGIEVLEINTKERTIKVRNAGEEQLLSLDKDAPKMAAATPVGVPGVPALPGGQPGLPGVPNLAPPTMPPANPFGSTLPARPIRSDLGAAPGAAPGVSINGMSLTGNNPPASVAEAHAQFIQQEQAAAAKRSTELNVILYEANRARDAALKQQGIQMPAMPPHVLLEEPPE